MHIPADWPADLDPGHLQRAAALVVVSEGEGIYQVGGGAEDHRVEIDVCDCAAFASYGVGWWCKHRLAVRPEKKVKALQELASRVLGVCPPPTLAGHLANLALGKKCVA